MTSRILIAAGAAIAAGLTLASAGGAVAVSHADCQIHGFRPYAHRHVDPGDKTISCERPALTGRFATSARCVAQALVDGQPQLGTRVSSELPLLPDSPARERANALNAACGEALAGCEAAAAGLGQRARCEIMDRNFAQ